METQKNDLRLFLNTTGGPLIKESKFLDLARTAPYCLASISHGIGFKKEKPIQGIRAFELSLILCLLEGQAIEIKEVSTNLEVLEGCVSFKLVNGDITLNFKLYCEYKNDTEIIKLINKGKR